MSPDCSVELARTSVTLPRSGLRVAVGLFLFVQAVYLLAATCHLRGQDQEYYYRIARSIARERTFAIEPLVFQNKELAGARGRDRLFYAQCARLVMGGCMLVLAILVKITSILALPAFLWLPNERGELLYRRRSTLVGLIVPVAIGLGAYGWYKWIQFGSFTAIGYSNLGSKVEFRGNALGQPVHWTLWASLV